MYCSKCGKEVTGESCNNCGQVVEQNTNSKSGGSLFAVLGWLFNGIALLFVPVLFGGLGVVFGYLHRSRSNKQHGTIIMILGVVCAILGTLLGMVVGMQLEQQVGY